MKQSILLVILLSLLLGYEAGLRAEEGRWYKLHVKPTPTYHRKRHFSQREIAARQQCKEEGQTNRHSFARCVKAKLAR